MQNKIVKLVEERKIQTVFMIFFTSVSLLCFLAITTAFVEYTNTIMENYIKEKSEQQASGIAFNIEMELEEAMNLSDSVYYRILKEWDVDEEELAQQLQFFYEENKNRISNIAIVGQDGIGIQSYPQKAECYQTRLNYPEEVWNHIEKIFFSNPHMQQQITVQGIQYKKVITVSRYVELKKNGTIFPAVLLIDINYAAIERIFQKSGEDLYGYHYLENEKGESLYHPREQRIESGFYEEKTKIEKEQPDGFSEQSVDGKKYGIYLQTIGYTGWKLVGITNISKTFEDNVQVKRTIWLIVLVVGTALMLINGYGIRKITRPIRKLSDTMEEFSEGNLEVRADVKGNAEVTLLSDKFNEMVLKIKNLMDKNIQKEKEQQEMQMKLLQSQINPHFLYNTLDSIIWMIQSKEYKGASEMVSALAKFFRISLNRGEDIITLQKELEHARQYLKIQNIRFQDKFEYIIEADERLYEYICPKLIIQPLVENAIYHGMEGMCGDGEIQIRLYEVKNQIQIDVIDNGEGMSQEQVEHILHHKVKSGSRGSGIGVYNVNQRIGLYFGERYGVSIVSEIDEGTTVRITMPKVKKIESNNEKTNI